MSAMDVLRGAGRPNWRAGAALVRSTWLSWMQARSFFFLVAFGWMVPPLIYLFVWSTVAGEEGTAGMTRDEFIVYYLLLILVNQVTYAQTNWTVGDTIRTGTSAGCCCTPCRRSLTRWRASWRARW